MVINNPANIHYIIRDSSPTSAADKIWKAIKSDYIPKSEVRAMIEEMPTVYVLRANGAESEGDHINKSDLSNKLEGTE